jgi:O-antigen ligase
LGVAASGVLAFVALSVNRVSSVSYTFVFLLIFLAVIASGSRNALFGVALVCSATVVFLFLSGHRFRGFVGSMILIGVVGTMSFFAPPSALERQASILAATSHVVDHGRLRIWDGALLVLRERPLLGHGVGQFGPSTSLTNIEEALSRRGLYFDASAYLPMNHAHNLWLNWAVERGLPATALFSVWLMIVVYRLNWRSSALIGSSDFDSDAVFRLAATLVVLSTIFFGIGNTSWHHEHGMLAAIIIAIAFSLQHRSTRKQVASSTPPASPV